jgi:hypothetical protein
MGGHLKYHAQKNAAPRFTLHALPNGIWEVRRTEKGSTKAKSTGTKGMGKASRFTGRFAVE